MTLCEHAIAYAAAGIPVFPCQPVDSRPGVDDAKAPLTRHGYVDASTDVHTVRRWWMRRPDAAIGMPTGEPTYDVLDIDVRDDGDGLAAMHRLRRAGVLAGCVQLVRTPSTGWHLYFPASGQRCSTLPGQYVDLKATGGYVIVPPSHVTTAAYTGRYRLLDARDLGLGAPLDWNAVRRLLAPTAPARSAKDNSDRIRSRGPRDGRGRATGSDGDLDRLAGWVARQPEGNRNNALFYAANRAIDDGATDLEPLVAAAVTAGLSEREAARAITSALMRRSVAS